MVTVGARGSEAGILCRGRLATRAETVAKMNKVLLWIVVTERSVAGWECD